jgi:hypothetical protein
LAESSTLTEIATVASAVFTAGAAMAAWRSASEAGKSASAASRSADQAQRAFDVRQRADMALQILVDRDSDTTELVFVNVGGGIAKAVAYMLVGAGRRRIDFVEDGFMKPGDKVRVHAPIPPASPTAQGVVVWLDADNTGWAVRHDGRKVQLGRGHEWSSRAAEEWDARPREVWALLEGDDRLFMQSVSLSRGAVQVTVERAGAGR